MFNHNLGVGRIKLPAVMNKSDTFRIVNLAVILITLPGHTTKLEPRIYTFD